MGKPLLSVVVPTKNRYLYLKELIGLIKSFNDPDLVLVIQDNSDDNTEILDYLDKEKCDGVEYFYSNDQIPATENADRAILHSTGEYVCFLGDDDAIMRWSVDVVRYMKREGVDSLIANKPNYSWPDIKSPIVDYSSTLNIDIPSSNIEVVDSIKELRRVQKEGFLTMGKLPRVYHGIVSRETLDKIYEQTGSYFPGPCPDMSNAVALCFVVGKHVYIDMPVVISGAGYHSAAGMGARHKHSGKISDVTFLPKNTEEEWEETIPKYWLGQTIWPNTAIKALRNTGHDDYVKQTNFPLIYGAIIAFHPSMTSIVTPFITFRNFLGVFYYFTYNICLRGAYLIKNIFVRHFASIGNTQKVKSIPGIIEAEQYICEKYPFVNI